MPTERTRPTEKSNWSALLRGLLALIVFAAVLIIFTVPASAGTYSVYSCKGPANEALGAEGWVEEAVLALPADFDFTGTCATSGPTVSLNSATAYSPDARGLLVFKAPANTTISDFALTRALNVSFSGGASGIYSSVVRERNADDTLIVGCVKRSADCEYGLSVPETVTPNLADATEVGLEVSCNAVSCAKTDGLVDVRASLKSARFDLADNTKPQISNISGSLISAAQAPGARNLVVAATDVGGGIRRVSVSVDGAAPETHELGGTCQEPFSTPLPCPLNLTSAFAVSTAQLAAGEHSVTVTVEDAGGEIAKSPAIPFAVLPVDPGPPIGSDGQPLTNGTPAVERPQLSLSRSRIESMGGGMTTIVGTLRAPDGTPIAGATVLPVSIDLGDADAPESALPAVVTGPDGSFSIAVVISGAKRVRISFRPSPGSAETAVASVVVRQALNLSVKRSKARVKPRGTIVLSGVLTGAGSATNEAPVEINALVGGKWRAVGVVETNAKGKYSWKYRFVSVRRATTFKFRALVRRSAAWPWPTEVGKTVSVRVAR